jgi:hypothetical protein
MEQADMNFSLVEMEKKILKYKSKSNSNYDFVIGVSGGLDSTYLLVKLVDLGFRPLAVHMDNNWNSSISSSNLRKVLDSLNVDLITRVMPWTLQKEIQKALIFSNVPDIELLYDNALHEVCYREATSRNIKLIVGGSNFATEGVEPPSSWVWKKFDGINLKSIAKSMGISMRGYPLFTYKKWLFYSTVLRITWFSPLDYFKSYSRKTALEELRSRFDYVDYGSKHFENVFTRFYQGYILPKKFGYDKRKPHLSNEILNGSLRREEALEIITTNDYHNSTMFKLDLSYVLKKLEISADEFQDYLSSPPVSHGVFRTEFTGTFLRWLIDWRHQKLKARSARKLSQLGAPLD